MKILLVAVNAKYTHMNPALYGIRAYAGEYAEMMEIAEYTVNQFPKDILTDIYRRKPEVIGFSVYIWNAAVIEKLLADLKKILPDTVILLGGPEAAFRKEEILNKHPSVDGVFFGEGEEAWKQAAGQFAEYGKIVSDIPGLFLRNGKSCAPEILDMDSLPFFYTEENIGLFENRMLYYETSRGCPYRCSYCLSSIEKKLRFRSVEKVYPELEFFLDHRVRIVKFIDRTFNADRRHAMAVWRYLKEHDNGITRFHFEIEADLLTEEELDFLKTVRKGLFQLEIGVQTTDEQVLREISRSVRTEKIRHVVRTLSASGNIPLHVDLIAGLPGETLAGFIRSFNEVYGWGADELQLGFLKVLHGTVMEEKASSYGLVCEEDVPYEILKNNWISYEDIVLLKDVEEQLERYGNSGAFRRTMKAFLRLFGSPFEMFVYLKDFCREHTGAFEKQSRISSYRMLRECILEKLENGADIRYYDALLLTDLYEKEKMKVRPAFFGGGDEQHRREKEMIRAEGITENVHIEFFGFSVRDFLENGTVVPADSRMVFYYEGQGAAVKIEEKIGTDKI